jgi:disulfide oxidoreductase YuzD
MSKSYVDVIKQKGYDTQSNIVKVLNAPTVLDRTASILPHCNGKYIVTKFLDLNKGIQVYDRDLNFVNKLESIENDHLYPVIIWNDRLYAMNFDIKKKVAFDILTGNIESIDFEDTFYGGGCTIHNLHISGLRHNISCFDLFRNKTKWIAYLEKDWYGGAYANNETVFQFGYRYPEIILRDMVSGEIIEEILISKFKELREVRGFGNKYVIDENLIVSHGPPPLNKVKDPKSKGKRLWFGIDANKNSVKWICNYENPIINVTYADDCSYAIYFNPKINEYSFYKMDLRSGKIIQDYSIHKGLINVMQKDKVKEFRETPVLGAPCASNSIFSLL